ncbi:hypothetical protein QBC47DRAFT_358110 [Echria macrotheca]|uniref:Uncharacterized protein n=1 Tax=Echria macrotheca TaxID=438768 RepID=A0AAJ0BJD7_9PEZI|nr:hypothetical protein QBC47DRAFT_358110 [Echria macrotheca]
MGRKNLACPRHGLLSLSLAGSEYHTGVGRMEHGVQSSSSSMARPEMRYLLQPSPDSKGGTRPTPAAAGDRTGSERYRREIYIVLRDACTASGCTSNSGPSDCATCQQQQQQQQRRAGGQGSSSRQKSDGGRLLAIDGKMRRIIQDQGQRESGREVVAGSRKGRGLHSFSPWLPVFLPSTALTASLPRLPKAVSGISQRAFDAGPIPSSDTIQAADKTDNFIIWSRGS